MKRLDDIWQEYIKQSFLSRDSLKELAWNIEYDTDPAEAITIASDMGLKQLGFDIAKQLNHEDDYIRELSIGCLLGRLKLPEYAEKGLQMAQEDSDDSVRDLSIFNIGEVINQIEDKELRYKIACYLYQIMTSVDEAVISFKGAAYKSILAAMEIPILERPRVRDLEKDINFDLVESFRKKYGIEKVE